MTPCAAPSTQWGHHSRSPAFPEFPAKLPLPAFPEHGLWALSTVDTSGYSVCVCWGGGGWSYVLQGI